MHGCPIEEEGCRAGLSAEASGQPCCTAPWLQFLVIRWYGFPEYSSVSFSIKARTSFGSKSVLPIKIDFLNTKLGHCFGSTSKIPVVAWS
ncbi:hypothetical protein ACFXTH_035873 [Malus domestica]